MSRASRRARGRQLDAGRSGVSDLSSVVGSTRQVGALRFEQQDKSISIDVAKLEAPSQVYDSDVSWIDYSSGRLSWIFGKRGRGASDHLESCLEVRFPAEDFAIPFWRASVDFFERLERYVGQWPTDFVQLPSVEALKRLPVSKFHSEWATVVYMSHSGTQASMDFYQLSPAAIARFTASRSLEGLRLRAVVRVQMSTFDMAALTRLAGPVHEAITRTLPASHQSPEQDESAGEE